MQLSLFTDFAARHELERKYRDLLLPTSRFNRRLVSYQANKSESFHRWFKFKEGFSARLVQGFIEEFDLRPPQHILDPFAGASTTLLVAREHGVNATGIEVMPMGELIWQAKSRLDRYDVSELQAICDWVASTPPKASCRVFPHLPITEHAFDRDSESELMWYDEEFRKLDVSDDSKILLRFVLLSILEDISYTSKDGQFLRWDSRSLKVKKRNAVRLATGKSPAKPYRKRKIQNVQLALLQALDRVVDDIVTMSAQRSRGSKQELIVGSVLEELPQHDAESVDAVITSPPYCNRYDYTRTYALELAFMGIDQQGLLSLRQSLLSCTVENRSKIDDLRRFYTTLGRKNDFDRVISVLDEVDALEEIITALKLRRRRGEVNNSGIISMVEGYFIELAFVTHELSRVCKNGAQVAIVNDNVRYSGETIPVDLLMTDIASKFGFEPEKIYVLPQRKGNSSQQMGNYGREALRKSILIWTKNGQCQ